MEKVKTFLQKWIINNLGIKILALVFAFVLWIVITNTIDPVTTRTIARIPVQILNEDKVLDGTHVYTVQSGSEATVVVSGNRSIVGALTADDFIATADFSELSLTNAVPINVELTGEKARYAGSLTTTQKTNSMVISLETMKEKLIKVEVQLNGTPPEDLIVEDAAASPARVTLHAPETIADSAERAVAIASYDEITGAGDTVLKKKLIVYDSTGSLIDLSGDAYLSKKAVVVTITTSKSKTVPVTITPYGEPAEGYELSGVTLSKTSVSVRGADEALEALSEIRLPSELLYIEGEKSDVTVNVNIEDYLPYDVLLYGDTGTVTIDATITKKQKETTTKKTDESTDSSQDETET